jgi:S1-C subfamily serine protease
VQGLLAVVVLSLACATVEPMPPLLEEPTPSPTLAPRAPAPPPPPTCTSFVRPGVLSRSVVTRTVDAGLGRWLAGVVVDPAVQKGRFRGWVVRSVYPGDPCYKDVDLRPGDTVVRINDKSIERPEQANEVFLSLRGAPALVVELVRAGAPLKLTFPIEP